MPTEIEHMSGETTEEDKDIKEDNDEAIINEDSEIDKYLKDENSILPETVTVLESDNGVKIYLVGTAHFSKESQMDVMKTIRKVKPCVVMLELCASRTGILQMDEESLMKEAGQMNFQKLSASIKQHGMVQGMLQVLMLNMSVHLTKKLGMAPGGEFRTAFREARKIPGCTVQLGDRPIKITLRRALSSLSVFQKLKLAFSLIFFNGSISKEDVEKCKQRDMLEEMLREMTGEFPSLSRVFVAERDIYLAHSLKKAAMLAFQNIADWCEECAHEDEHGCHGDEGENGCSEDDNNDEKINENGEEDENYKKDVAKKDDTDEERASVCGHKKKGDEMREVSVVGVVGIGHSAGIVNVWGDDHDINSVLTVPPASRLSHVFRLLIKTSFLGLLGYGCYRAGAYALRTIMPASP